MSDFLARMRPLQEQRVRVCQTVTGIDRVVGQILEQLKRLGQADKTIIVYSSDNGILHGEHGYGGKCLLYDPSIRVPLLVIQGRQDPYGTEEQVRRIQAGCRGPTEVVLLEDCGHAPHRDQPADTLEAMTGFLGRLGSTGG